METSTDERYERARKRVRDVRDFYVHLGVYLIVNGALFAINMLTSPDTLWFYWPLLGWGVGVAIHAFSLVTEGFVFGEEWEERKTREIVQRQERRDGRAA